MQTTNPAGYIVHGIHYPQTLQDTLYTGTQVHYTSYLPYQMIHYTRVHGIHYTRILYSEEYLRFD